MTLIGSGIFGITHSPYNYRNNANFLVKLIGREGRGGGERVEESKGRLEEVKDNLTAGEMPRFSTV